MPTTRGPVFDGTTMTATSILTPGERAAGAAMAAPFPLAAFWWLIAGKPLTAADIVALVLFAPLVLASATFLAHSILAATERRVVFSASEIKVYRRYWWRSKTSWWPAESVTAIPFSAVRSVGLVGMGDEDSNYVLAVMRLRGRPFPYHLWSISPPRGYFVWNEDRDHFMEQEPTIRRLTELTGLPRKDTPRWTSDWWRR